MSLSSPRRLLRRCCPWPPKGGPGYLENAMEYDKRGAVLTPIKSIRAKCIECSGGNVAEVRRCHLKDCALWPYRMGKRPKFDAEGSVAT